MSTKLTPAEFVEVLRIDIDMFVANQSDQLSDLHMPYEYWVTGFVINLFKEAGMLGFLQQNLQRVLDKDE